MTLPLDTPAPKSSLSIFHKLSGGICVVFLVWAAFGWLLAYYSLQTAQKFEEEGAFARAQVIGKYLKKDSDGDTDGYLELKYTTEANETLSRNRNVGSSIYQSVETGNFIEIRYLKSDPETIELQQNEFLKQGNLALMFAAISSVFAPIAFWAYGRQTLDAVKARKFRKREEVELLQVKRTGWWVFGRGFRLIWRENTGREGKSLQHKAERLMGFRPGDTIVVFHGKNRSWWAGDVGDRE